MHFIVTSIWEFSFLTEKVHIKSGKNETEIIGSNLLDQNYFVSLAKLINNQISSTYMGKSKELLTFAIKKKWKKMLIP